MDEKVLTLFLAIVCLSTALKKWKFVEKVTNKKTHDGTQLKALTAISVESCIISCARTQTCQSISYNDVTQQCLLSSVLSDDHPQLTVDGMGFTIWDRTPPLETNETKPVSLCTLLSPCLNNAECTDIPGLQYTCANSTNNDISICALENPCQNDGTCVNHPGPSYSCNCSSGYSGQNCSMGITNATGKVLLFCGNATNDLEIYDINNPANSTTASLGLNSGRQNFATARFSDGRVLIIGGTPANQSTYIYDPKLETITNAGLPNISYNGLATVILNDVPVVCGGSPHGPDTRTRKCKKLIYDTATEQWNWEAMHTLGSTRSEFSMVVHGNYIYAAGTIGISGRTKSVERYSDTTGIWEDITSMNYKRSYFGLAVLDDKIYACGGSDSGMTCERYDPALNTWTEIGSMQVSRIGGQMVAYDGKLYMFNGESTAGSVEMYDPGTDQWTLFNNTLENHENFRAELLYG